MQLVTLARELVARGWLVELVSLLPPSAFVEELESAGIPIHNLNIRNNPFGLFRLVSILRKFNPTVVHGHMFHANLLARFVRLFYKFPVLVCTAHSVYEGGRLRNFAYRFSDSLCDLTTQICQAGMDRYIRIGAVPKGKIRFVPNGVNVARFFPDLDVRSQIRRDFDIGNNFVWLAVGRHDEVKDYPNLIRAFCQARVVNNNALLLLVGDGPLRSEIEQLVASLGLLKFVRFLGIRQDIPALMNAADAYVMSSRFEGMPIVLLEAAATGLPVLATRVGGISEVIHDGISGMLVAEEDSNALASSMVSMMNLSTQSLLRMGRNGLEFVMSRYTLSSVVDQWEMIYHQLLTKNIRN